MTYKLYEVRRTNNRFAIVHTRTGYTVEAGIRYLGYATELCRRYNQCL